jgi:hypothetical protein
MEANYNPVVRQGPWSVQRMLCCCGARDGTIMRSIAFTENNKSIGQHLGANDELIQRSERALVARLQNRVSICG